MSPILNTLELVIDQVRDERARQDEKWGSQRHLDDGRWTEIFLEELGEAAKAKLEGDLRGQRTELVQATAVLVAWIESIDARGMIPRW